MAIESRQIPLVPVVETRMEAYRQADITTLHTYVQGAIDAAGKSGHKGSTLAFYETVATGLPSKTPLEANKTAIDAIEAGDPRGREVLLFLNLHAVLAGAKSVAESTDGADVEDIIQEAVLRAYSATENLANTEFKDVNRGLYAKGRSGASQFISERDQVPYRWVYEKKHDQFEETVERLRTQHPYGMTREVLHQESDQLAEEIGPSPKTVRDIVAFRMEYPKIATAEEEADVPAPHVSTIEQVEENRDLEASRQELRKTGMGERIDIVLEQRYREGLKLEEIGTMHGFTRSRAGQMIDEGLLFHRTLGPLAEQSDSPTSSQQKPKLRRKRRTPRVQPVTPPEPVSYFEPEVKEDVAVYSDVSAEPISSQETEVREAVVPYPDVPKIKGWEKFKNSVKRTFRGD